MPKTTFSETILTAFPPITLAEMEKVRLMNRIDIKYMTTQEGLCRLLSAMETDCYVQEIGQSRVGAYRTLYLDTANADMYLAHHNGRKVREKIRVRNYVASDTCFFEVKDKTNKGRTHKARIQIPDYEYDSDGAAADFLRRNALFRPDELTPHVETVYDRITLVNRQKTERLTIDINLAFRNHRTGQACDLSGLVIIELKQDASSASFARALLSGLGIPAIRFSKYCAGAVLTDPAIKQNRFKPKLRQINKLINYDTYGHI